MQVTTFTPAIYFSAKQNPVDKARQLRQQADTAHRHFDEVAETLERAGQTTRDASRGARRGMKWGLLGGAALVALPGGIPLLSIGALVATASAGAAGGLGGAYLGPKLSQKIRQRQLRNAQRQAEQLEAKAQRAEQKAQSHDA